MRSDVLILRVLVVDDDEQILRQFERGWPEFFEGYKIDAHITLCDNFDKAVELISDPSRQYDLIALDTYRDGEEPQIKLSCEQFLQIVDSCQNGRFCPLVVFSSSSMPNDLETGPFTIWADKAKIGDIERAIAKLLDTGVPQAVSKLRSELNDLGGKYLWEILDKRWSELNDRGEMSPDSVERLIRRRAAIQIAEIEMTEEGASAIDERDSSEYYICPAINNEGQFNLGDIIQSKDDASNIRVVLTPHCYLRVQRNAEKPRVERILTIKTIDAMSFLEEDPLYASDMIEKKKRKYLEQLSRSPAKTGIAPDGRHWLLPEFLDIPYCFCDFVQCESVEYRKLQDEYNILGTLAPPYAEALQSCFLFFYGTVGLPVLNQKSIANFFEQSP